MQNGDSTNKRNQLLVPSSNALEDPDDFYSGYYPEYYPGSKPEKSERRQLFNILEILKKKWWLILGLTILGTCLMIVYEAQKPDYYSAEVRIQINNEINPGATGNTPSSIVLSQGSDPTYFSTQLQILEGPGLLRRVVKTMDLEHNPTFFRPAKGEEPSVWQNVARMFGFNSATGRSETAKNKDSNQDRLTLKEDSATNLDEQAQELAPYVSALKSGLAVTPVKDNRTASKETRLIRIEYTHFDPAMATKVVNTLADAYVLQNLEQKVQTNASASDFLQKRVAELQSQIRSGEERLINYARDHQILSLDSTQNTVVQKLADLNGRLSSAENDRISAEAAYRAALQNPMTGTAAESKDSRTAGLESQLTSLRQQLDQLKVEYTDEWPEVKKIRTQIASIERELSTSKRRSVATQLSTLEQSYKEAAARERELRTNFDQQRGAVLNQNEAAINYKIIQQEIETSKSLLANLLQRSRETEVVLNGTPNNVHIVDRALVPRTPDGPQRGKNVIIAFFASMLAGIGLAFALNWLDDTIKSTDDFEGLLGLPVLGLIPAADSRKSFLPMRVNGNGNKLIGKHSYQLDSFEKPLVVEAFHQLRTSLLLSTAGGAPRSVLVTSGQPFEGKTITSLNLAKSLAQLGGKVLLIDADLRCPKLHFISDLENNAGLSTLVTASELTHELIDQTIKKDVAPNLDILSSGPKVPNPANLFGSAEMSQLLERLGYMYAHVIIDSPPVLYFADSLILATSVDAVVIVARANMSPRDVLSRAKKKVQDVRGNVVGIVVNDVPLGSSQYYYTQYYNDLDGAQPKENGNGNGYGLHLDI